MSPSINPCDVTVIFNIPVPPSCGKLVSPFISPSLTMSIKPPIKVIAPASPLLAFVVCVVTTGLCKVV